MKTSHAQSTLINHLKKRDPKLSDNDVSETISGLRRFVILVQKIYTQPQSTLKLVDVKIGKKVIRKDLLITTTMEEIVKTKSGKRNTPLLLAFRTAYDVATKGKKKNGN